MLSYRNVSGDIMWVVKSVIVELSRVKPRHFYLPKTVTCFQTALDTRLGFKTRFTKSSSHIPFMQCGGKGRGKLWYLKSFVMSYQKLVGSVRKLVLDRTMNFLVGSACIPK